MDLDLFFGLLVFLWVAGEILLAVLTTTRKGKGKIHDRGTQIILWVVIFASVGIGGWMERFIPVDMPGSSSWLQALAFGILVAGIGVRVIAIVTLGKAFSANVATVAGQRLQRSGLYGLVRHPSYLGLELILLAIALYARTWACFAVMFVPPTLAVLYRIHVEEAALGLAFGADYEDYSSTTKRLIPGVY